MNYIKIMKNKKKKLPSFPLVISVFVFFLWVFYVFADDIIFLIPTQVATSNWSSQSLIEFSKAGTTWWETYYADEWWNSTVIGNYFKWYYYDNNLWFFRLDWSSNPAENVSIISSTEKCWNSYGYKLGWYAQSAWTSWEIFGYMDFDYSSDIYVYYCEWDKKLHGYAYTEYLGFQNFEWIWFEILPFSWALLWTTSSNLFVNDTTNINQKWVYTWSDSNYWKSWIGWDIFNIDDTKESIIYIIR